VERTNKLHTTIDNQNILNTLYSWEAPERQWQRKTREWYVIYSTIFVFLIGIATILQEVILIFAIIAFVFLWFTQAAVSPEIVTHKITSIGIKTYGKIFRWKQIKHYWISEKGRVKFLNLEIVDDEFTKNDERTQRLSLLINPEDEESIFYTLLQYVDYGDKSEVGYNFITERLNGKYTDITKFLSEDTPTQDDYLEAKGLEKVKTKKKSGDKISKSK
jgi:hypothetical protein